jgi:hypothetical protein
LLPGRYNFLITRFLNIKDNLRTGKLRMKKERVFIIKNIIISIFTLTLFFPLSLNAEILFLKDGSVLYGTISKETDKNILFKKKNETTATAYARSNIIRVRYDDAELNEMYVYKKDGT